MTHGDFALGVPVPILHVYGLFCADFVATGMEHYHHTPNPSDANYVSKISTPPH